MEICQKRRQFLRYKQKEITKPLNELVSKGQKSSFRSLAVILYVFRMMPVIGKYLKQLVSLDLSHSLVTDRGLRLLAGQLDHIFFLRAQG